MKSAYCSLICIIKLVLKFNYKPVIKFIWYWIISSSLLIAILKYKHQVKLSGDGAALTHNSGLIVCSFSLLDDGQAVMSSSGESLLIFQLYLFHVKSAIKIA